MTFQHLRELHRADRARATGVAAATGQARASLTPGRAAVILYRFTQYFSQNDHRLLARLCWQLNHFLTSADLSPGSDIGPGLVILHPAAVMIHGRAGRNLTVVGRGGFGGGLGTEDVGAGPGFAWVGDDVTLDMGAMILGAQRIGHRVHIGPNCTVIQSLPDDAVVLPLEPRVRAPAPASA